MSGIFNLILSSTLFLASTGGGGGSLMSHVSVHSKSRFLKENLLYNSGFIRTFNTRINNLYVEGFDDYVITEIDKYVMY